MESTEAGSFPLFKKELRRLLLLNGSLRNADRRFGKVVGYFSNVLGDEAQISVQLSYLIGEVFKIPTRVLYPSGRQEPSEDPVAILLCHRERRELPANAFLDTLAPRLEALLQAEVGQLLPASSEHQLLEALEELRFGDRTAAQQAAEELAMKIVNSLGGIDGPKPRTMLGELAVTIALWGTIQRSCGLRDLAVKAFTLAFPLAKHSHVALALAICYRRAAYLLRDLGRPLLGYDFIREALLYFSMEISPLNTWKCHTDRGLMLGAAGRFDQSNEAYELALERLPGSEWRYRVGALQGLGTNAQLQGKHEKARSYLIAAANECQQEDLILGHIKWARAAAEFELGETKASRRYFEEATLLLARFGSAGDVALICVDHVEVLLQLKEHRAVVPIIAEVATWLPRLQANPILSKAFEQFLECARATRIGLDQIPKVRADLKVASKRAEAAQTF